MKEFIISKNDSAQRLNKFIEKAVPNLPAGMMHKYIRAKRIKCNGKRTEFDYRLQEGDVLQLYINDEFFEKADEGSAYKKVRPDISVIYEDDNILLVDKAPGVVVHADDKGGTDTLVARIQAYLYHKKEWNPDEENSFAPALCNRIDRNTGGIVIAAKTAEALRILNDKIKNRELTKKYLCVVHGSVRPKSGKIEGYILKNERENKVTVHKAQIKGSKTAVTLYKVLAEKNNLSLVECELITGRTHQIRAHFAYIGHPLLGDGKYGTNLQNKGYANKYQALYSYKLKFDFETESGALSYLKGKEFTVPNVDFAQSFYQRNAIS